MRTIRAVEVERRRRELTQEALARTISTPERPVHQMAISLLERGAEFGNRDEVLRAIARCFGFHEDVALRLLEPVHTAHDYDDNPPPVMTLHLASAAAQRAEQERAKQSIRGRR